MPSPHPGDVIVIGAGIIGAACAFALAGAGLQVTVLDAAAAAAGTSGQGEGNLLVSDKEPGPELTLALRSLQLWQDAQATLAALGLPPGIPPLEYERKGGLVVATTEAGADPLLQFAKSQLAAGVSAEVLDGPAARKLEPDLNPAVTAAVYYPQDAQVQPVAATEALLAAARARGAATIFGTRVTGPVLGPAGELAGVTSSTGEYRAGQVIVAAGPWSGHVATALGASLPVRPRRGVVLVTTRLPRRIRHKVYDADYVGAVGSGDAGLQTSAVVESTVAGPVLIGSSRRRQGFDTRLDLAAVKDIAARAIRLFPFLADTAVMRVYGGFRPFLPDHLPAIGPDAEVPGLWHASGHEGAGIGLSLGTAELIAALLTGTSPPVDPGPFAPGRAALRTGAAA